MNMMKLERKILDVDADFVHLKRALKELLVALDQDASNITRSNEAATLAETYADRLRKILDSH
jgi:hypothetical protein